MKGKNKALLLVCTMSLAASSWAQYEIWRPGTVGRIVMSADAQTFVATTEAEGWEIARFQAIADAAADGANAALRPTDPKAIRFVRSGTRAGLIQGYERTVDLGSQLGSVALHLAKVRVAAGPLKGTVLYTPSYRVPDEVVRGEPIHIPAGRLTGGAFDESTLKTFYDAVAAGDDSMVAGLTTLKRVLPLDPGTHGVVYGSNFDREWARVKLTSGKQKGKILYIYKTGLVMDYKG